ncbi:RHS repeat-associated core domain-containing protein [Rahnella woolbedingensis]|uniref:RHS repeat domain-containing protein n=1 Tax=Rahnella woolbedingensis TaxID=1510574 RepID=UPI003CC669B5
MRNRGCITTGNDPTQGRYITQDPIGLIGDWNLYIYSNDPIQYFDPMGLKTCTCRAFFSGVGPNQATGIGALGFSPPNKSVAINPAAFGLPYGTMKERVATQKAIKAQEGKIKISTKGLDKTGSLGTEYTIGDVGDKNVRNSSKTRFDIYRFSSQKDALDFGKQESDAIITGVPDEWSCPK